jgi:hypothetical protein
VHHAKRKEEEDNKKGTPSLMFSTEALRSLLGKHEERCAGIGTPLQHIVPKGNFSGFG